jgi:TolB-like protein
MSPEQARGNEVDCRTDIWSLGVILYELLTGSRPFPGENLMDVLSAVIERPPPPFSSHNLVVPELLERIVFKALQKEREKRYQTASELLADLKELSRKQEFPLHAAVEEQTAPLASVSTSPELEKGAATEPDHEQTSAYSRQSRRVFLAGGLALLLLVVASLIYRSYANRQPPIESIAVMPFVNASENTEVEYLSDGMTDMLITSLSQVPRLSVKARSSVFRYKGKDASPQQLGKELNVQAILTGRVLQRGNDLKLHIELVEAQTETVLWSHDYSRSTTNLAALQGEIALDVSQKLRARLSGAEEQKVSKDYTANSEAKDLYLKGRFHVLKLTPQETATGVSYLQRAIQLIRAMRWPTSGWRMRIVRAVHLAPSWTQTSSFRNRAAAQKAVDLDDDLAEAHTALALAEFWYAWNWNEAENQFKRALNSIRTAPTRTILRASSSNTGRHAEALVEVKRARALDPYSVNQRARRAISDSRRKAR